jgi:hypothetical protein
LALGATADGSASFNGGGSVLTLLGSVSVSGSDVGFTVGSNFASPIKVASGTVEIVKPFTAGSSQTVFFEIGTGAGLKTSNGNHSVLIGAGSGSSATIGNIVTATPTGTSTVIGKGVIDFQAGTAGLTLFGNTQAPGSIIVAGGSAKINYDTTNKAFSLSGSNGTFTAGTDANTTGAISIGNGALYGAVTSNTSAALTLTGDALINVPAGGTLNLGTDTAGYGLILDMSKSSDTLIKLADGTSQLKLIGAQNSPTSGIYLGSGNGLAVKAGSAGATAFVNDAGSAAALANSQTVGAPAGTFAGYTNIGKTFGGANQKIVDAETNGTLTVVPY